ncbi:FG-GAP repeat domain-containing protein [Nannocystis punicea]|uniref:VCBS repeat-containing protein n=1 Tax=Nannocystis punicea TaxID=2995304 RepID=A0ABY7GW79_9BACT|nr:VCBS repeat-containing protein [Nannocystis poenicansa]WAS91187.1 VCBS repeat-containing protein [Nannocystis poenicansa]
MRIRVELLAAGLCLTACGPDVPAETDGSTSGTTSSGSTSSDTPTDGGFPSSDSDPYDDSYDGLDCECYEGETQDCEVDGQPGAQICEGWVDFDVCDLNWSACHLCERGEPWPCNADRCGFDGECEEGEECGEDGFCAPLPSIPVCDRQPLMVSELELQGAATQVELVDLDGDGALDLVALLAADSRVEVALGDGDGGFLPGTTYPTGLEMSHQSLAIADFDTDGSPDLAIDRWSEPAELSLLFGQAGSFAEPVLSSLPFPPNILRAGDFDGDANPDLVMLNGSYDAEIVLYRGDGMGEFTAEPHDVPGDEPFVFAVGAVAGEPRLDVVVTRAETLGAEVLEYAPGIGFTAVATLPGAGATPYDHVAVGDIDGDAAADVVAHRALVGSGQIQTWPQLMLGSRFLVEAPIRLGPIADIDGDGRGDLLAVEGDSLALHILYVDAPCIQAKVGWYASGLATGDLDGDGKADIVGVAGTTAQILRTGP